MKPAAPATIAVVGPAPPRSLRPWLKREFGLRWWPRQDSADAQLPEIHERISGEGLLAEQPCSFEVSHGAHAVLLEAGTSAGRWRFLLDAGGRSMRLLDADWPPPELLLGPPLLLAHALGGRYCLHASAIGRKQAWLLSAPSGSGKSTLAACAMECGWQRLGDDLALLMLAAARGQPASAWLLPRMPQLKLGPQALGGSEPWPCAHLVQLQRGAAARLQPLDSSARLQLLLGATVGSRLFGQTLAARHLDWATRLAASDSGLRGWHLTLPENAQDPAGAARQALKLLEQVDAT